MATKWVVTAPTDRIGLDGARHGETTFTVTNPTDRQDIVVLDIVAGDGADPGWFTVDEPQRRVPPKGSVSYLVTVAVPGTVPAGTFSVQTRAYSADSTPEEDSVLSGRLAVEVAPAAVPVKRRRPWWVLAVAGLVVVTVVVVLAVVLGTGGSTSTPPTGLVGVPNVGGQSEEQARTNLAASGLRAGTVRHKSQTPANSVLYQSILGGQMVARGTAVDLVVSAALAAPAQVAPADQAQLKLAQLAPPSTPLPATPTVPGASAAPQAPGLFQWTEPDSFIHRWQVTLVLTECVVPSMQCHQVPAGITQVDHPSFTPIITTTTQTQANSFVPVFGEYRNPGVLHDFQWQVAPVDDFGTVGPPSTFRSFQVAP
ncbi:MAG TPA: PASTA domain-containing protein [Rugosimonospora sp.]|nr:PASTA domain-containing protein [Rugosimonospora sp.]